MNDPFLFRTICIGGPFDGESITEAVGKETFVCHRVESGCEVMPGDCVVDGLQTKVEQETYVLVTYCFQWPTGVCWSYYFWLHESLTNMTIGKFIQTLNWHLSDCYVIRERAELITDPTPLFSDGRFKLSEN